MSLNRLLSFYTISSNTDPGAVTACTAAATTQSIAKGIYKLAAMGSDLLWKLGSVAVTTTTGAYLAAGDQEVIHVLTATSISFIRTAAATADGNINIVPIELFDTPTGDYRKLG